MVCVSGAFENNNLSYVECGLFLNVRCVTFTLVLLSFILLQ